MSRGQQGIGISAAGMYGVLTTGKPVRISSKISKRKPIHYYEIQIDTKNNRPEILNGRGNGVDIPAGPKGETWMAKHGVEWVRRYEAFMTGTKYCIRCAKIVILYIKIQELFLSMRRIIGEK